MEWDAGSISGFSRYGKRSGQHPKGPGQRARRVPCLPGSKRDALSSDSLHTYTFMVIDGL